MDNFCIKTERLFLRILDRKDKEAFYQYRSLPEVYKYQFWRPANINDAEKFIYKNSATVPNTVDTWLQVAICLNEGSLIGDIGIHFLDEDQIEIGYTLSPDYQGYGYAVEAVKGIITYAFSIWNKHRITASVDPDNIASIKLLEKIGFRKEAHFIKSLRIDDYWYDDCIYSMLEEEWREE